MLVVVAGNSGIVSVFCVPPMPQFVGGSQGFGDALASTGADIGVGKVEVVLLVEIVVVAADFGVIVAEKGVNGVLARGESSVLAERSGVSIELFPDLSRLSDICLVKQGTAEVLFGITSGVRFLGDIGRRPSFGGFCDSS